MIRGTPEKAAGYLRPLHQRLPALDQFVIAARQLPATIDASAAADIESHAFEIVGHRLVVVERAGRGHGISIGWMLRDFVDKLSV